MALEGWRFGPGGMANLGQLMLINVVPRVVVISLKRMHIDGSPGFEGLLERIHATSVPVMMRLSASHDHELPRHFGTPPQMPPLPSGIMVG